MKTLSEITCRRCGSEDVQFVLTPDKIHFGKYVCNECGKFIQWAKKPRGEAMRYIVFGGSRSYPKGGWGDFKEMAQTIDQAKHIAEDLGDKIEWAQIVDVHRAQIIWIGHDDWKHRGICAWRKPAGDNDFWGASFQEQDAGRTTLCTTLPVCVQALIV